MSLIEKLREMPPTLNEARRLMEAAAMHIQDMLDAIQQHQYTEQHGDEEERENARISMRYAVSNYHAFGVAK